MRKTIEVINVGKCFGDIKVGKPTMIAVFPALLPWGLSLRKQDFSTFLFICRPVNTSQGRYSPLNLRDNSLNMWLLLWR